MYKSAAHARKASKPGGSKAKRCIRAHGAGSYQQDAHLDGVRRQVVVGGFRTHRAAEEALTQPKIPSPPVVVPLRGIWTTGWPG